MQHLLDLAGLVALLLGMAGWVSFVVVVLRDQTRRDLDRQFPETARPAQDRDASPDDAAALTAPPAPLWLDPRARWGKGRGAAPATAQPTARPTTRKLYTDWRDCRTYP